MKAAIEVILNGVHLWIYPEDLARRQGALMPTPTHAQDTCGFGMSYAHLYPDGAIMRYREQIGTLDGLVTIEESAD